MEQTSTSEGSPSETGIRSRCHLLPWDSSFFGRTIGRLDGDRLNLNEREELLQWCHEKRVDCLYFLANPEDPETVETAEQLGFGLKDLRLTMTCPVTPRPDWVPTSTEISLRAHQTSDVDRLAAIARDAHTDSRFFFDRRFDRELAGRLYETWIRNACSGAADSVIVAELNGAVAGYLSCHLRGEAGDLGLMGVADGFRGRGIARSMLAEAIRWYNANGATEVTVVTQGRNVPAQRSYQQSGFRTRSLGYWYHKWFH
jgi:dTDP-4-amino-4,6-dideoxy-D-galactose acyltransferase